MGASLGAITNADDWYLPDWVWRAGGTLSPSEKEARIRQAAWDLIKASGGTLGWDEALAQARQTETDVLSSLIADPSQAGLLNALAPVADSDSLIGQLVIVAVVLVVGGIVLNKVL